MFVGIRKLSLSLSVGCVGEQHVNGVDSCIDVVC